MMTHAEMLTYIKDSVKADLSPKYIAASIPDMEGWVTQTPFEYEKRVFSVFMDGVELSDERDEYSFLIRMTLPRIETPETYSTLLLDSLRSAIKPSAMGLTSLASIEAGFLYPGGAPEGGYGSFIDINLVYTRDLDDCD